MFEPFKWLDQTHLSLTKWQEIDPCLRVGFSTRQGGISKGSYDSLNLGLHVKDNNHQVVQNRKNLANRLSFPLKYWVCGEQIHRTNIKVITKENRGYGAKDMATSIKGVDGLITRDKNVLCTAFFADCVPLYFFDPESEYIGIAHAGWRGTVANIASQMVEMLCSLGVKVENLLVAIGPSIGIQNYEVDKTIIEHIPPSLLTKVTKLTEKNKYLLDLKRLNSEILLQNGILRHNISITNYCTYEANDLFFSYRRDRGQTGRMLGFIGYRNNHQ